MPIEPGQRLLHYSIVEKLGEGGMGVVWRAVDTSLDREVAIKVLPEEFSDDAGRLARFEREAKLLASLNNPRIAAIYGLHEADGIRFLAMELVEGEDLAQRLERGPVSLEEAINVADQVALGLMAAHDNGVIHRDLKPANVRVTPEGKVKILDFGLAKAVSAEPAQEVQSESFSPTMTSPATVAGMVMGTVGYMSPEQARGLPVDRRTDIWAYGCLLYEMLMGRAAFRGETPTDLLAALLHVEPDIAGLPPTVPADVRRLLGRCLRKDPSERLRDIGDVRLDLLEARSEDETPAVPAAAPGKGAFYRTAGLLGLVGILLGVAAGFFLGSRPGRPATGEVSLPRHLPIALDRQYPLSLRTSATPLAFSPDGASLIYSVRSGESRQFVRVDLDEFDTILLEGTQSAVSPFFSPDGRSIAFFVDNDLYKVPSRGGRRVALTAVDQPAGGSWGDDGWIYFSEHYEGISRVRGEGGAVERLIGPPGEPREVHYHGAPQILPGAKGLVYTHFEADSPSVHGLTLEKRESALLAEDASLPRYASNHLIYAREGDLLARSFDPVRMQLGDSEVSVLEPQMGNSDRPTAWAVAPTGIMAYVPMTLYGNARSLTWVDQRGIESPISAPPRHYNMPRVSPDGGRIAVDIVESDVPGDIWVFDLRRETLTRVTIDPAHDSHPLWLPTGRDLVFNSNRDGSLNLYRKPADGSGEATRLTQTENGKWPLAVTRDGEWVVVDEWNDGRMVDLVLVRASGDHERRPLLETRLLEGNPALSPDGRWIAYEQGERQRNVFVQRFPEMAERWQVSIDTGYHPLWSPDGKELYFRKGTGVYAVAITDGPELELGKPVLRFEKDYLHVGSRRNWDISGDGRFLMVKPSELEDEVLQVNLVFDFLADRGAP